MLCKPKCYFKSFWLATIQYLILYGGLILCACRSLPFVLGTWQDDACTWTYVLLTITIKVEWFFIVLYSISLWACTSPFLSTTVICYKCKNEKGEDVQVNTSKLGSSLLESMLKEVGNLCSVQRRRTWGGPGDSRQQVYILAHSSVPTHAYLCSSNIWLCSTCMPITEITVYLINVFEAFCKHNIWTQLLSSLQVAHCP